jgi:hypothetical protein
MSNSDAWDRRNFYCVFQIVHAAQRTETANFILHVYPFCECECEVTIVVNAPEYR